MSPDQAMALVADLFRTMLLVVGPVLGAALVAGVLVGIVQTATQINDASIGFLVKVIALVLVGMLLGPQLVSYILDYTRASFGGIAQVVR
jgi:flagellar biosynthetic protein FliQ